MKPVFPAGVAVLGLVLMVLSSKQGFELGVWVDEHAVSPPFTFAPLLGIAAIGLVLFVSGFVVAVTALVEGRSASRD